MLGKKPGMGTIHGTRQLAGLKENAGAPDVKLSLSEIEQIDRTLDLLPMSDVFGGSKILTNKK